MIARLLQFVWCAMVIAMTASAWLAVHWLGRWLGPGLAALFGVLVCLLLHPAAVACNFLASRWFGDPPAAAKTRPERLSWFRALRMLDREIDASIRGFWFANPFRSNVPAPVPALAPLRRHAILFVHGYFCNRAVWHSFMRDAAGRGYRCEAVTLDRSFGPIEAHADAIDAAMAAFGSNVPVFVVAHSMGGLAVRSAMRTIEASRVTHVVTLGSPHHGTWSARFGRGTAVRQMRRDSAWLSALAADEAKGIGLPRSALTSIFSRHDDIVYPQSTAVLEGAENVMVAERGHVALLYDRGMRTLVFDRLDRIDSEAPRQDAAPDAAS